MMTSKSFQLKGSNQLVPNRQVSVIRQMGVWEVIPRPAGEGDWNEMGGCQQRRFCPDETPIPFGRSKTQKAVYLERFFRRYATA